MEGPPEYHSPPGSTLADSPPAYDDTLTEASISRPGSSHSSTTHGALLTLGGLPSRFNWYYHSTQWKGSTYHIGAHKNLASCTLVLETGWKGTRMSLYQGIDKETKTLIAEAFAESSITRHSIILLPASSFQTGEEVREELRCHTSLKTNSYTFSMRVPGPFGEKPVVEQFEWRQSHGNEVRILDNHGWGYKLVRLQASAATPSSMPPDEDPAKSEGKKPAAAQQDGMTSDGKEVVAVWADSSEWSKRKLGKFQFMGSGASGELGDDWARFAVMSGLRIWGVLRLGASGGRSSGK